jgi:hypothetical protein
MSAGEGVGQRSGAGEAREGGNKWRGPEIRHKSEGKEWARDMVREGKEWAEKEWKSRWGRSGRGGCRRSGWGRRDMKQPLDSLLVRLTTVHLHAPWPIMCSR